MSAIPQLDSQLLFLVVTMDLDQQNISKSSNRQSFQVTHPMDPKPAHSGSAPSLAKAVDDRKAFLKNSGKTNIITHTKLPDGQALNFVPGVHTASTAVISETSM